MQRLSSPWLLAGSVLCCALALAGLAHSYRVERHERAAQREAVGRGVVSTAPVLGSLTNKQRRTRVRVLVRGVERQASVFAGGRAYTAGTTVKVAYLPSRPERVFVVGARPWTWWAAMRRLFFAVAVAGAGLAIASLALVSRRSLGASSAALAVAALLLASGASAAGSGLTVRSSSYGRILFDGRGFVLYAFTKDARGRSACSGKCAAAWPPYLVRSKPTASAGASAALIGTTRRADGKLQATYAGRPLYYYVGDRSPGQILCQNVREFGGLWLVVRATGALVR